MLRSFGAILLLGGSAILFARADSIALLDTSARAFRARPGGPRILDTRTLSSSLAWKPAGYRHSADISRQRSQFCGRACSPLLDSPGRIPGTVSVGGSRDRGFLRWLSNLVLREMGERVTHKEMKACKAAGNC